MAAPFMASLFVTLLAAKPCAADPQYSAGLLVGLGHESATDRDGDNEFLLGARTEALFGRDSSQQFAVGPYLSALSSGFDDLSVGGGASLLVPWTDPIPAVVSVGPAAHWGDLGWAPAVVGQLYLGSRTYNFSGKYSVAAGFVLGVKRVFNDAGERTIYLAAHMDGALLSLPFIALFEWLRPRAD
ncbi:MAG: hypothetical protein HRU17_21395 [Polyangiaceae bacterium]|nr:hypothetical protein [Polyangiaceae bacterium]